MQVTVSVCYCRYEILGLSCCLYTVPKWIKLDGNIVNAEVMILQSVYSAQYDNLVKANFKTVWNFEATEDHVTV